LLFLLIEILECENELEDDISSSFYKRETSRYLVESGKKFFELGTLKKLHYQDGSKCFESAKSALDKAIKILERIDQEEIRRSKVGIWLAKALQACGDLELHNALK
jgi:hypothetical protein